MIKSLQIALLEVRKWLVSPRMYMVFLMLAVFEWTLIRDVRAYAISIGMGVSCWYFPFLFVNGINCLFFYLALILMYCNAPYVDEHQIYLMIRSGRKCWFVGQILYTILASLLFFGGMLVLSVLEFVPYVGFSYGWADVLETLSQNPRAYGHGLSLNVPYEILQSYEPFQAVVLCFIINVGIGILLGLLIFYVNLWKSRGYGAAVALGWVTFSNIAASAFGDRSWMLTIAPTTWSDLSLYCGRYSKVSLFYVSVFLVLGSVLLVILILIRSRKYSIEAMEEI